MVYNRHYKNNKIIIYFYGGFSCGVKRTDEPTQVVIKKPIYRPIVCALCLLFPGYIFMFVLCSIYKFWMDKNWNTRSIERSGKKTEQKKKLRWKNSHNKIISKIPPNFCLIRSNLRSNRIIIDMKIVLKANVLLRCYEHLSLWNHQQCFLFTKICIKDQIGWSVGWLHYRPQK